MEITYDLCEVFNKIDTQRWNKSHVHYSYITMWSICCHSDKSPKSLSVIDDWYYITRITSGYVTSIISELD